MSSRWVAAWWISASLGCAGCMSPEVAQYPIRNDALAADITQPQPPRLARAQVPDPRAASPITPPPPIVPVLNPQPSKTVPATTVSARPAETQQVSAAMRGTVRVSVRAWVNGRPIFDDEVAQAMAYDRRQWVDLPEPRRSEKYNEVFDKTVNSIIEQELMFQDAIRKLEKVQPTALAKLKDYVEQEFEKSLKNMRDAGVPEDKIKQTEPIARRMLERSLVSMEYARNRIVPQIQSRVGLTEIRDYYESHQNEFRNVDKVKWLNVFIAASPEHPQHATIEQARAFARQLLAKCRTPDDFRALLKYDNGDSKLRNGEGYGQRRGEIRPAECEEILFKMRDGDIGPPIDVGTGIHLLCLVKRDFEGQQPLDDALQRTIRKKLENLLAEREYKRIANELRTHAVIRIERDPEQQFMSMSPFR